MPRLPQPGGDEGNWGTILNDYLSAAHNADGTLKTASISESQLDTTVQAKLNSVPVLQVPLVRPALREPKGPLVLKERLVLRV